MRHHHRAIATDRSRSEGGFTWSEFTLVVASISFLILAAVWAVSGIRSDTRDSDCQSSLRALKIAAETYRSATDAYPASADVLIEGKYVKSDQIEGYRLAFDSGDLKPRYTATGRCA